ncbi:DUF4260 domain-containing protein [Roseomonas gilardii]|uniref:DUF4260 domain-containing protein n=1 Tax=Roseomonas gilardii TaxID=257708 RepID=UPI0004AFFD36|nr:DUF4260 domain-containing protein [Roseomonas gilardii]SUE43413.1 Uncharacterised protein [Roseomonas gilardii subsp. rosea]
MTRATRSRPPLSAEEPPPAKRRAKAPATRRRAAADAVAEALPEPAPELLPELLPGSPAESAPTPRRAPRAARPRREAEALAVTYSTDPGHATGAVNLMLRLEGLALATVGLVGQIWLGTGWWAFVLAAIAPDLSILAYLGGRRLGSILYNLVHVTPGPLVLGALAVSTGDRLLGSFALAWLLHIGIDRALGHGLKYASGFHDTHLGRIGRAPI